MAVKFDPILGTLREKDEATVGAGSVGITELSATGTPDETTYLRGDNTWATVSSGLTHPQILARSLGA